MHANVEYITPLTFTRKRELKHTTGTMVKAMAAQAQQLLTRVTQFQFVKLVKFN